MFDKLDAELSSAQAFLPTSGHHLNALAKVPSYSSSWLRSLKRDVNLVEEVAAEEPLFVPSLHKGQ